MTLVSVTGEYLSSKGRHEKKTNSGVRSDPSPHGANLASLGSDLEPRTQKSRGSQEEPCHPGSIRENVAFLKKRGLCVFVCPPRMAVRVGELNLQQVETEAGLFLDPLT